MGNNYSKDYLESHITKEIKKHKKNIKRSYLNLKEFFKFEPLNKMPFRTSHIGLIYVIDEDKSGKYTQEKISKFYRFVINHSKNIKDHELPYKIQALCTHIFVKDLLGKETGPKIVEWIINNLRLVNKPCNWEFYPEHEYVHFDFIEPLYILLDVKTLQSLSLQDFFYLLQQVAEEEKLLSLKYPQLDDYIPLTVVRKFIENFLEGYKQIYLELGLDAN